MEPSERLLQSFSDAKIEYELRRGRDDETRVQNEQRKKVNELVALAYGICDGFTAVDSQEPLFESQGTQTGHSPWVLIRTLESGKLFQVRISRLMIGSFGVPDRGRKFPDGMKPDDVSSAWLDLRISNHDDEFASPPEQGAVRFLLPDTNGRARIVLAQAEKLAVEVLPETSEWEEVEILLGILEQGKSVQLGFADQAQPSA